MMSLPLERVKIVKDMNMRGQFPEQLQDPKDMLVEEEKMDFADMGGEVELPDHRKKKNNKKKKGQHRDGPQASGSQPQRRPDQRPERRPDQQRGQESQQKPRREDGQRPADRPQKPQRPQGQQRPPQGPRPAGPIPEQRKEGEGGQQPRSGPRRNKNRNRNKGNWPGGERPPENNPPA